MKDNIEIPLVDLIVNPLTHDDFPNERLFEWLLQPRVPILFSEDAKSIQLMRAAIRGERIRFIYMGGSSPGKVRKVSPACLFAITVDGTVYLQAFCHERNANRIFRLDRILPEHVFN